MSSHLKSYTILVNNNGMGSAENPLQIKLAQNYFKLLYENVQLPENICFYADGVKLTITGSPLIDVLQKIEQEGVKLMICKTCLDYYKITDKVAVGNIAGMTDIIESQQQAKKVITI
jgi:sulfur relay (sulfurtransferase) complex TusBCD TusD component (DsrE family)